MHEISLWEAVRLWFSGEMLDSSYSMLSVSFLVWGRIGKVASIVGGLVVVLDYVGDQRLASWGRHLQEQPLSKLIGRVKDSWVAAAVILVVFVQIGSLVDRYLGGYVRSVVAPVSGPLSAGFVGLRAWLAILTVVGLAVAASMARDAGRVGSARLLSWAWRTGGVLLGLVLLIAFADGLASLLVTLVVSGVALWLLAHLLDAAMYALNPLVIKPTAWALARESPGQPIRWAGFLLLLTGQLLDLLAS